MSTTHRRDILKALAAAGISGGIASLDLGTLAFANPAPARAGAPDAGGDDILVVLFLRGGCDVLNLIGPANDPAYVEARPADLRVTDAGAQAGIALDSDLADGVDFRLHPEAAALHELYRQNQLALVLATGIPNGSRSHFEAQEMMDRGVGGGGTTHVGNRPDAGMGPALDGWVTRLLRQTTDAAGGGLVAVSTGGGIPHLLQGWPEAVAVPDLRNGFGLPGGPATQAVLDRLYPAAARSGMETSPLQPVLTGGRTALDAVTRLNAGVPRGPDGKVLPYQPAGGGAFEGDIGRSLETVARLIRMNVGLRVACVDMGGWDTHEGQAGRLRGQFHQLSTALATFWNDLSPWHDRLTVVTLSEFGRRLRSNQSGGTDHGHGSAMLALGGGIRGGRLYGRWPGLAARNLDERVDLAATTDYRQVLADILRHRQGLRDVGGVFPGFSPAAELGLFV